MKMEMKYVAPEVEVLEVAIEKGFEGSVRQHAVRGMPCHQREGQVNNAGRQGTGQIQHKKPQVGFKVT